MHIEIYGRDGCGFCKKAVEFCEQNGFAYIYHNYSRDPSLKTEMLLRNPEAKTVPQIFVDGVSIGGYDDLKDRVGHESSGT